MAASHIPASSPFQVFQSWLKEADEASATLSPALNPRVASLSTVSKGGQPSSRVVRTHLNEDGSHIAFVCGANSRKVRDISENSSVTLLFYWTMPKVRQIRVEGKVELLSDKEISEYFYSFPRQLQASLAVHSEVAKMGFKGSKSDLFKLRQELIEKYADQSVPVPLPSDWTGYHLVPTSIEFTDGALLDVDNFIYTRTGVGADWCFEQR